MAQETSQLLEARLLLLKSELMRRFDSDVRLQTIKTCGPTLTLGIEFEYRRVLFNVEKGRFR